ncbi:MAG: AvaI/BsoBI family type II restriction endonuclease [Pyrinomonadaceae bacterium]
MASIAPYLEHLTQSEELITTKLGFQSSFASIWLEFNRRATPYVEQARALKHAASRVNHSIDLDKVSEIRAAIRSSSSLASVSGVNFVEELVYRFLITRGDTLGGSMRNVGGVLAQRKLARALMSALALSGTRFRWQHSSTRAWADGTGEEPDIELYLRAISWKAGNKKRTAVFNLGVPFLKNNVDLCLFDCEDTGLSKEIYKTPKLYIALGELKGGIDPAGADEHWKTARTALLRIQSAFSKSKLTPHTFFIGAAIEKRMAREIWEMLNDRTLENAANLTNDDQVASISRWLVSL